MFGAIIFSLIVNIIFNHYRYLRKKFLLKQVENWWEHEKIDSSSSYPMDEHSSGEDGSSESIEPSSDSNVDRRRKEKVWMVAEKVKESYRRNRISITNLWLKEGETSTWSKKGMNIFLRRRNR